MSRRYQLGRCWCWHQLYDKAIEAKPLVVRVTCRTTAYEKSCAAGTTLIRLGNVIPSSVDCLYRFVSVHADIEGVSIGVGLCMKDDSFYQKSKRGGNLHTVIDILARDRRYGHNKRISINSSLIKIV